LFANGRHSGVSDSHYKHNSVIALNVTLMHSRVIFVTVWAAIGSRRPSAKLLLSARFLTSR